ncbi:protein EARLY FLOWERING 4-like [Actinidia eriantha]|uniref:protein EARLY FLOWERING 4-like n=1 Tax=Actinidia eriantha TaxID=165200 RepID=UPI00258B777D|nr:protein EARLY FLOWERING 4-like [Actinidia eriantha]
MSTRMDDDEASTNHHLHQTPPAATTNGHARGGGDDGDGEFWSSLTENLRKVQSVLDRNSELIQQANENHHSKIPDNLVKNVALIQEINGNISKVVSLYSDLNVNLSSIINQRNGEIKEKSNNRKGDDEQDSIHQLQTMTRQ